MKAFSTDKHQDKYLHMLLHLLECGEDIEVRGRPTKEILLNVYEVAKPQFRCILIPGRRWNPWLAMSEGLWIISGKNDVKTLLPYNKRILEFSDNGEALWGAYGYRMKDAIPKAINNLKRDQSTRRVVIPIYKEVDLEVDSKDIPCNTSVMLKVRKNALHMAVTNRSNDIHWGLFAVNLCQFSMLQEALAACVGVKVGSQVHISHSFHVYTDEHGRKITESMSNAVNEINWSIRKECPYPENNPMPMFADTHYPWPIVRWFANYALGEVNRIRVDELWFQFAREFLEVYREETKARKIEALKTVSYRWRGKGVDDWLEAGRIFLDE